MALGPLLGPILGLSFVQSVFLGALLALSSTVVAVKVLMTRGELPALHGRIALGILIAQDLAVVPMVIILPALTSGANGLLAHLGLAALKASGILLGAYLLATRAVPWILGHVALARTRELFLLGVVSLALGTALVTQFAGLSLAFGAFLAGLVVAESDYRTQVVAEVLPLRDLFASLFFVSVGMLINPAVLVSHAGLVALLGGAVILGKAGIVALVVSLLGMPGRAAVLAGLSLAQIGEFSFVLARIGIDEGAIPPALFDLTLATALVTIVLLPLLLRGAPLLLQGLERLPAVGSRLTPPAVSGANDEGIPLVRQLRARGVPVIYGDAANPAVLEHAGLDRARVLAILMPDAAATGAAALQARRLNPRLDIVARARDIQDVERLRRAGATAVVQPEFEAGLEVIRHTLHRYGVASQELAPLVAGRRQAFYQQPTAE